MSERLKLKYSPRLAFRPFHNRAQRFAVLVCHRRAGKTVACVRELEKGALTCPLPNPRFAYIAPLYRQAKQVAWDYAKQGYYQMRASGLLCKKNESELKIEYPNGGALQLYGADNPDSLRGIYLDGCVLDEYANIDPTLLTEVILPALADRKGWLVIIGTPKGRNAFYTAYRDALKNPAEWFTLHLRASQSGIIPADELARLKGLMEPDAYEREFECSFDVEASTQFISYDTLKAAFERAPIGKGVRALGVDPARFGGDRTGFLFRAGNTIPYMQGFNGLDTVQGAGRTMELVNKFRPQAVFIDEIGIGAGVLDMVREMPIDYPVAIYGVNFGAKPMEDTKFVNLRTEAWWRGREWLKRHAALNDVQHKELIDDLTAPEYEYDVAGRIRLESKDSIRDRGLPSPDLADALMQTFAFQLSAMEGAGLAISDRTAPAEDPFDTLYEEPEADEDVFSQFTVET